MHPPGEVARLAGPARIVPSQCVGGVARGNAAIADRIAHSRLAAARMNLMPMCFNGVGLIPSLCCVRLAPKGRYNLAQGVSPGYDRTLRFEPQRGDTGIRRNPVSPLRGLTFWLTETQGLRPGL